MKILAAIVFWGTVLTILMRSPCFADSRNVPISSYNHLNQITVNEETLNAYSDEIKQFYTVSSGLRHLIWEKIHLFAEVLADPDASKEDLLALQAEIQELNNKLQKQELSFRWDLGQHFPEMATDKYRGCLGAATGTRGPGR
jgi:hypothetical protein